MMDVAGPFLLFVFVGRDLEIQEMDSFDDCQFVKAQLEDIHSSNYMYSYCIAEKQLEE